MVKPLLLSAMCKSLRWKTDTLFKTEISCFLETKETRKEFKQHTREPERSKFGAKCRETNTLFKTEISCFLEAETSGDKPP